MTARQGLLSGLPSGERIAARWRSRPVIADIGLLLFAGLALITAGMGLREPWPADEPRFALIARDMVRSGQWLIPHVGGELYADKPPLFMWLTAALHQAGLSLRVAFLLPSLAAGLGMLVVVYDLARRLWDREVALAAGLLLLLSLQFTLQARTAQLDALLALWTTLGLYGLARHLLLGPDWKWYAMGGFAMGLGVITKGVGFLPLFLLLPWAWLRWRHPGALPGVGAGGWRWLLAPGGMLAVVLAWLLPLLLVVWWSGSAELAAYRDEILFRQTVTRYADTWTHLRPGWYYLVKVIPWAWFPVTLALPWLVPAWREALRRIDARSWLLLGFVAAVVLFFSLSPGKRGVYLLPALPALVLAAAPFARGLLQRPGLRLACTVFTGLAGVALLALALALALDAGESGARLAEAGIAAHGALALSAVLGLAAVLAAAWGRFRRMEPLALVLWLAGQWLLQGWVVAPMLDEVRSASGLMAKVEARVPAPRPLAMIGWKEQFALQLQRPVVHFGFRREPEGELRSAAAWLETTPQAWLLAPADQLSPCLDEAAVRHLGLRHGKSWVLADASALTGRCPAGAGARLDARLYDPAIGRLRPMPAPLPAEGEPLDLVD